MSWNLISQCVIFAVSSALLAKFLLLRFDRSYRSLFLFVGFQFLQSIVLIVYRWFNQPFDYKLLYCPLTFLTWVMTIWIVYSMLMAILESLPGILRFSIRFLNIIFFAWVAISLTTVMQGYFVYHVSQPTRLISRLSALVLVLDGRFLVAELAVVFSILVFVLRFPIRVRRNLAVFSVGVVAMLLSQSAVILAFNYLPEIRRQQASHSLLSSIPAFIMVFCFGYWIWALNEAGETAAATFGREWQSVPKDHLVRQLEALNTALLRSRE